MAHSFERLARKKLYDGSLFQVYRDTVRVSEEKDREIDMVVHPGAVGILPVDASGRIWLVSQYRHPTGRVLLEIPAGTLSPDEVPEQCARRECREEIGMAPGDLTLLGRVFLAPGYSTELLYFFYATDLMPAPLTPDDEEDLKVSQLSIEQTWDLIYSGEIEDAKTIVGLTLLSQHLKTDLAGI